MLALSKGWPEVMGQIQMRIDVQVQEWLPDPPIDGQKIVGNHRPRIGNHETNIQIVCGFFYLAKEMLLGEVHPNSSILHAELGGEPVSKLFQCGEPSGDEDHMEPGLRQLAREFFADP